MQSGSAFIISLYTYHWNWKIKIKSYDTGWCGYLKAFLVCVCCHQIWQRRPMRVQWWVSRPVPAEWRPRTPATRYPETIQTLHHLWLLKDLLPVTQILQNLFSFPKELIYFPWFERKKLLVHTRFCCWDLKN